MCKLLRQQWRGWLIGFVSGVLFSILTLTYTVSSARTVRLQDFTIGVWIFVVVGILVVLLQLIPAVLLFFTFMTGVYKKGKKDMPLADEEATTIPDALAEKKKN